MEGEISAENQIFRPDKLKIGETLEKVRELKNGDILFLTHNSFIIRLGEKNILMDPSFDGQRMKNDPETILPGKDGYKNFDQLTSYPEQAFDIKSDSAARLLAPEINYVFISHADSDHMRASTLKTIADRNPSVTIFFPTGILPELQKINGSIPLQFQEIHPQSTDFDPTKQTIPANELSLAGSEVSVRSFEVQHTATHNQGLLFTSENYRILVLPDGSMAPETLKQIDTFIKEAPLTRIITSAAKYNPADMYRFIGEEKAKKFRDEAEESFLLGHSAYLPVVLLALTDGKTPIDIVHQGFYHKSKRGMNNFGYRVPIAEGDSTRQFTGQDQLNATDNNSDWLTYFKDKIYRTLTEPKFADTRWGESLKKLSPVTGKTRTSESNIISDSDVRWRFSRRIRRWLNLFPAPKELVDNHIHMPGPNEIVNAN